MKHEQYQEANNWVSCKCGKLFSNSRKGNVSKYDKLKKHIEEVLENE